MFYVVSHTHTHHGMPRTAYGRADSRPSIQRTNGRTDGWALDQENFVQPPLKLGVRYLLCQSLTPNILLSQPVILTSMKSWFFRLIIPKVSTPHSRCQISQILTGQSWIDWTWRADAYGMRAGKISGISSINNYTEGEVCNQGSLGDDNGDWVTDQLMVV